MNRDYYSILKIINCHPDSNYYLNYIRNYHPYRFQCDLKVYFDGLVFRLAL